MPKATKIQTFGSLTISNPEKGKLEIASKKNCGLLGYICTKPGLSIAREQALSLLWSNRSREQATKSLRTELSKLKKQCNKFDSTIFYADRYTISLVSENVTTDIAQLEHYLSCNEEVDLIQAMDLYHGDFLENLNVIDPEFEEWVDVMRQKYRNTYHQILNKLLTRYLENEDLTNISLIAEKILKLNVADEFAHRALMYLYFIEDNAPKAILQYQRCREVLGKLFNVSPSTETQQLLQKIKDPAARLNKFSDVFPKPLIDPEIENGLSIAVLPFTDETENGDLTGTDISDLLLSAMSKYKWLCVPPKRSTLKQAAKFDDPVEVGQALEMKYVLDGSVKKSKDQYIVTIELTQIAAKKVVWREPYKITFDKGLQHTVSRIINQIEVRLRYNEVKRITINGANRNSAYECLIQGIANMHDTSYTSFPVAKKSFDRAIFLAPDYPVIYAWTILWQIFCFGQGWSKDPSMERNLMEKHVMEAITRDPDDGLSLAIGGHVASFVHHDFDKAISRFEKSLALNPHIAFSWMLSSATYSYMGETTEALERLAYAESLRPIEPHFEFMYSSARCIAHTFARDYESAVSYGRKTISSNPDFTNGYKQIIVPLVQTGRLTEAKGLAKTLLLKEPGFSIRKFRNSYPFSVETEKDQQIFIDALCQAGIPQETLNGDDKFFVVNKNSS